MSPVYGYSERLSSTFTRRLPSSRLSRFQRAYAAPFFFAGCSGYPARAPTVITACRLSCLQRAIAESAICAGLSLRLHLCCLFFTRYTLAARCSAPRVAAAAFRASAAEAAAFRALIAPP